MPAPIPDLSRDQQCHHYQAPTGQRCGSPALKGEYYCYHHHLKHYHRANRALIDPEITGFELPVIEDRVSIVVALSAVIARLAANTIDTKRAGLLVYSLQTALQALPPDPPSASAVPVPATTTATDNPRPTNTVCHSEHSEESPHFAPPPATPPKRVTITKESLLYFLRARHCYNCNTELFPAEELTQTPYPSGPPLVVEENETIQRRTGEYPTGCHPGLLLDLKAAATGCQIIHLSAILPERSHQPEVPHMKKLAVLTALALSISATGAFAETLTGYVSDAMCAKNPHKAASADHAACAQKCIKGGEKPVLVVGEDKVYTITNPDILIPHAGEKVTVEADVKDSALTIKSVK